MGNNQPEIKYMKLGEYLTAFEGRLKKLLLPPIDEDDKSESRHFPVKEAIEILRLKRDLKDPEDPDLSKEDKEYQYKLVEKVEEGFGYVNEFKELHESLPLVWITNAFWDNHKQELHITDSDHWLGNDQKKSDRFKFMSELLLQKEFSEPFEEPMSELLFKVDSRPHIIELEWPRKASCEPQLVSEVQNNSACCITDLGSELEKIDRLTEKYIPDLCKMIEDYSKDFDKKKPIPRERVLSVVYQLEQICNMAVLVETEEEIDSDTPKARLFKLAKNRVKYIYKCLGLYKNNEGNQDSNHNDQISVTARLIIQSLIWNRLFDDLWEYIYYIPALLHDMVPISGSIVATTRKLEAAELAALSIAVSRLYAPYHFNIHQEEEKYQARRAASAGILSRNMSHNIGSHVLPRIDLKRLQTRLQELYHGQISNLAELDILGELTDRMNSYLIRKADFIAESTTAPLMSTRTERFFSEALMPFVANTILIDTIAENEGFGYLTPKTNKNEDIENDWPSSIRFKFFKIDKFDDKLAVQVIEPRYINEGKLNAQEERCKAVPYAMLSANNPKHPMILAGLRYVIAKKYGDSDREKSPTIAADWSVALPGPNGEFALYSILENIIRNSAKHNSQRLSEINASDSKLELWVGIIDGGEDDFYEFEIYDTLTKGGVLKNLPVKLTNYLKKPIINDDLSIRDEAWGIAEIGINSFLLRGKTDYQWDEKDPYNPSIRAAKLPKELRKDEFSEECLVFRFYVMKARQAIFIGKELLPKPKDKINTEELKAHSSRFLINLSKAGLAYYETIDKFMESRFRAFNKLTGFQFAVIADSEMNHLKPELRAQFLKMLPFRVIFVSSVDPQQGDMKGKVIVESSPINDWNDDPFQLMKRIWQIWLTRWLPQNGLQQRMDVHVFLGKYKTTSFFDKWLKHINHFNNESPEEYQLHLHTGKAESAKEMIQKKDDSFHRVIYDRHGELLLKAVDDALSDNDQYISIDKNNVDFDRLNSPSFPPSEAEHPDQPWLFPYQLIEAGLLRVLVVDERIAQRSMRSIATEAIGRSGNSPKLVGQEKSAARFWHSAERAGVRIATHLSIGKDENSNLEPTPLHRRSWKHAFEECKNSDHSSISNSKPTCPQLIIQLIFKENEKPNEQKPNISSELSIYLSRDACNDQKTLINLNSIDVLIIHQGVIDNISISQKGISQDTVIENLENHFSWVVVESGRGVPPEVRKGGYKFLPYSLVNSFLSGSGVSKLNLTQSILELTRQLKNG